MKSKGTWVAVFFIAATVLVGYVLHLAFGEIFAATGMVDSEVLGPRFPLSSLCGVSLAALLGIYFGVVNKTTRSFISQVVSELDKVAWPTMPETGSATVTVIVTCFIAAAILGVFDAFFHWLSEESLKLF